MQYIDEWLRGLSFYQLLFILGLALAVYMLPAIIGLWRHHPETTTIAIMCVIVGWTGIGWIAALAYSLFPIKRREQPLSEEEDIRRRFLP